MRSETGLWKIALSEDAQIVYNALMTTDYRLS